MESQYFMPAACDFHSHFDIVMTQFVSNYNIGKTLCAL